MSRNYPSKYQPHQGKNEKARRIKQLSKCKLEGFPKGKDR